MPGCSSGVPLLDESASITAGEFEQIGTSFNVEPGQELNAMTGDRDADLYVRFKYRPTKIALTAVHSELIRMRNTRWLYRPDRQNFISRLTEARLARVFK